MFIPSFSFNKTLLKETVLWKMRAWNQLMRNLEEDYVNRCDFAYTSVIERSVFPDTSPLILGKCLIFEDVATTPSQ